MTICISLLTKSNQQDHLSIIHVAFSALQTQIDYVQTTNRIRRFHLMRILTTSWVRSLLEFMSSAHTVVPLGLLHMRRLQSWFAQLRLDPVRHCLRMFCRSRSSRGWTWSIGETYSMCPDVWHFGEKSLLLYSSLQRWFSDWMGKERARLGQWGMCVLHWRIATSIS